MPALSLRNKNLLDADDPTKLILIGSLSFSFEKEMQNEIFLTSISTPVTGDPGARLFGEIIEWKSLPVNPLPVQVSEVQEWEKKIEQLNAIEIISGILNELSPEQIEVFEQAVNRRPFFK
jgi:hypothetical protein